MNTAESQREVNDREWNDQENWNGFWPFNLYFSKRDSRLWVPALFNSRLFSPTTINFGHRFGVVALALMIWWGVAIAGVIGWSLGRTLPGQQPQRDAVHDAQQADATPEARDREERKREQLKKTIDIYDPVPIRAQRGIK
jgi:hypothetical protein